MFFVNGGVLKQEVTGVQRYAHEILSAISKIAQDNNQSRFEFKIVNLGKNISSSPLGYKNVISTYKLPRPIWTQLVLPFYAKGHLLSLGNIGPIVFSNQTLCVHDANTHVAPESYSFSFRLYYKIVLPLVSRRVKNLVTVSEYSKSMLIKYGISGNRQIHVIPNGHEHVLKWNEKKVSKNITEKLRRSFVFMIGSKARHKNTRIIEKIAYELDNIGIDLVIAGRAGRYYQIIDQKTADNIILLGSVTDDDLAYLYSKALCLVFPSITEGFGLPPIEAMALGCPVIVSDAASLPEVCGEAALYAQPDSKQEWLKQIQSLLDDESLRRKLINSGFERVKKFSWDESARLYMDLVSLG